jgi:hypothetical protein
MCLVRLPGRRCQARNHSHRTLDTAVHRPCPYQLHHHHCSLDKFSFVPPLVIFFDASQVNLPVYIGA